jgi:hypothetical protein
MEIHIGENDALYEQAIKLGLDKNPQTVKTLDKNFDLNKRTLEKWQSKQLDPLGKENSIYSTEPETIKDIDISLGVEVRYLSGGFYLYFKIIGVDDSVTPHLVTLIARVRPNGSLNSRGTLCYDSWKEEAFFTSWPPIYSTYTTKHIYHMLNESSSKKRSEEVEKISKSFGKTTANYYNSWFEKTFLNSLEKNIMGIWVPLNLPLKAFIRRYPFHTENLPEIIPKEFTFLPFPTNFPSQKKYEILAQLSCQVNFEPNFQEIFQNNSLKHLDAYPLYPNSMFAIAVRTKNSSFFVFNLVGFFNYGLIELFLTPCQISLPQKRQIKDQLKNLPEIEQMPEFYISAGMKMMLCVPILKDLNELEAFNSEKHMGVWASALNYSKKSYNLEFGVKKKSITTRYLWEILRMCLFPQNDLLKTKIPKNWFYELPPDTILKSLPHPNYVKTEKFERKAFNFEESKSIEIINTCIKVTVAILYNGAKKKFNVEPSLYKSEEFWTVLFQIISLNLAIEKTEQRNEILAPLVQASSKSFSEIQKKLAPFSSSIFNLKFLSSIFELVLNAYRDPSYFAIGKTFDPEDKTIVEFDDMDS